MITFGAKYRTSVNIFKNNNGNPIPFSANFAELNPKDPGDIFAMKNILTVWKNKAEYCKDIYDNFNFFADKKKFTYPEKFFVLTKQNKLFSMLKTKEILGLVEILLAGNEKKTVYVSHIQVLNKKPPNISGGINLVGSGMLTCLKRIYKGKTIELDTKESLVDFYLKNGFIIVDADTGSYRDESGEKYYKMRYSNPLPL